MIMVPNAVFEVAKASSRDPTRARSSSFCLPCSRKQYTNTWLPMEPATTTSAARELYARRASTPSPRSEEHTSELQSRQYLVCRLLLEKKKQIHTEPVPYRPTTPRSIFHYPPHPTPRIIPILLDLRASRNTLECCVAPLSTQRFITCLT